MIPVPFGIEQRLMSVSPDLLDHRFERRPVDIGELIWADERDAASVHPKSDRNVAIRVGSGAGDLCQVWRQCLAGGKDLLGLLAQIIEQSDIAAKFIGDNIHRRFENTGDRRHGTTLAPQTSVLNAKATEVLQHCHRAFDEREIVGIRSLFAHRANRRRDAG